MARKPKKEEHVNHERWLVSYADFITLLFAFFTSLYAISTVDAKKAGKMVFSTRAAFNMDFFPSDKPVLGYPNGVDTSLNLDAGRAPKVVDSNKGKQTALSSENRIKAKTLAEIKNELDAFINRQKLNDSMRLRFINNNLVVTLNDVAFFAPGSATLRRDALPGLDQVAETVLATKLNVRIEGHSDDSPVGKGRFKSNWELSTARALTVVHYLMDTYGASPDVLSVAGFASSRATDPNDQASNGKASRRIDIVLLSTHQ